MQWQSGLYSDLTGVPDVSAYVDEGELATELNGYYTKEEVGGEIEADWRATKMVRSMHW